MAAERKSGPELLKLLTIGLIVLSHVTQTLVEEHPHFDNAAVCAFLDITGASADPGQLLLVFLRGLGALGNTVFFTISAWFLVDSQGCRPRKILRMVLDIWTVSAVILVIFLVSGAELWGALIRKSLLPTFYGANWYMTAYLLLYSVHGYLNTGLRQLSQAQLLRLSAGSFVLYFGCGTFFPYNFFPSSVLTFLTIYVAVAYMKRYLPRFTQNTRANLGLLLISVVGQVLLVAVTDFLNFRGHSIDMLKWNSNQNLLNFTAALALLNLFRNLLLRSAAINRLAGLTMLIYLIHENIVVRSVLRPWLFVSIRQHFGYDAIILWVFVLAAGFFLVSLAGAALYQATLGRVTALLCNRLYPRLEQRGRRLLERVTEIQ